MYKIFWWNQFLIYFTWKIIAKWCGKIVICDYIFPDAYDDGTYETTTPPQEWYMV